MANDYVALAFTLIIGSPAMLPVYATIIWVTVGNGIRFGKRYMLLAEIMAQTALFSILLLTPYWQQNPILSVTLIITAAIVPFYVQSLLSAYEDARRRAEEASLAKSRFLAQASHDLRQPVHAIGLFLASLRDTGIDANQSQIIDRIDRSLHGVSRLFRTLLDISTLDSGVVTPQVELFSLEELLTEIVQQNDESARWAGVNIRLVSNQYWIEADRSLLITMVQNLVSNAIKYAPEKPILIGARRRGGQISIEVHDCGAGISDDHLPRVFEEFYQIRERGDRDVEGVGLGLSIVSRLAGLMGLTVNMESRLEKGTSVQINGLQQHIGEHPSAAPAKIDRAMPMQGYHVVLIEDDRDVLAATKTMIETWGCSVSAFTEIPVTLASCDLIITDFDLGGKVTGSDCIAHIRTLLNRDVAAIVMTGHNEHRVRHELKDDAIPVLMKPLRPAELRSMITSMRLRSGQMH
ncbi:MAG: ATP-binding protein [Chakrabartia sp.]